MKSIRAQLLVTLVAVVVAGLFAVKGLPPDEAFELAVMLGEHEDVKRCLEWGADANVGVRMGDELKPILYLACQFGHTPVVELLLAYGADLCEDSDWTPLHSAAWFKHREIAELLISEGAEVDFTAACLLGMTEKVKRALETDATLANTRLYENLTPLHCAGSAEIVRLLIEHGAEVGSPSVGIAGCLDGLIPQRDGERCFMIAGR